MSNSLGPRWLRTTAGRLFIGLVVSQGLFYALERLLTGLLLAFQGVPVEELWQSFPNLMALLAAQLFSVAVGGLLAGGGQENGLSLGAITGAWNGVLAILFQQIPLETMGPIAVYGSPLLHGLMGAIGGMIGMWIWKPIASDTGPILQSNLRRKPGDSKKSPFSGPIAWVRVLLGSTLSVWGVLSAALLFRRLIDSSGGKLSTSDSLQDKIIIWEIQALALLLGGAFAGVLTTNGLKQGLAVAIVSSIILVGILSSQTKNWIEPAAMSALSSFILSLTGGWFGSTLFPPVVHYNSRKAQAAAQM